MKLRRTWYDALVRILEHGPEAWCVSIHGRTGGARKRMFARMIERGYCTRPPYKTTMTGRRYIDVCEDHYPQWRTRI